MNKPNILVIYTDQQRWDTIRANGNQTIITPNLDRLAKMGVNFDCCISQNPVCMPSRISMMTGQYCSTLRMQHMGVPVPEETLTIQKILSRWGYHTGLVGKLHYLTHANRDHKELHPAYDFDYMELCDEPGCYEDAYRAWVRMKAPDQLDFISPGLPPAASVWRNAVRNSVVDDVKHPIREKGERLVNGSIPFAGRDDLTNSAFVGEQTIEFIKRNKERPFFCFSGFYSPHSPWIAPQRFLDMYDADKMPLPNYPKGYQQKYSDETLRDITRGYYAMITEVDFYVGRILDALEENGLLDSTIIVFTSDHGEWLGEHDRFGKGHWSPDCINRVPLLFYVPKAYGGYEGRQVHDIVECADIVPTLLHAAGLQIPPQVQGKRLPVAQGIPEHEYDGLGLVEHTGYRALRFDGFHYVVHADGSEMLFDLNKDPFEYHNAADDPAYEKTLSRARYLLAVRMLKIESPLPRVWSY